MPQKTTEKEIFFFFFVINLLVALRVGSHFVHSLTVMVFCFRRCQISLDVHQMTSLSAASDKKSAGWCTIYPTHLSFLSFCFNGYWSGVEGLLQKVSKVISSSEIFVYGQMISTLHTIAFNSSILCNCMAWIINNDRKTVL